MNHFYLQIYPSHCEATVIQHYKKKKTLQIVCKFNANANVFLRLHFHSLRLGEALVTVK